MAEGHPINMVCSRSGVRVYAATLRALSLVCGSTLRVSHDNMTTKGNIYVLVRTQNVLSHFPFDEIYRRLLFFTLGRSVSAWVDYSTTKWKMERAAGWSGSVFFSFSSNSLAKAPWWWMLLYRTLRKVPGTTKVRLWEKTCESWLQDLLLLSFLLWCSNDRRKKHELVLHDASQIDYCRYWGRASLPLITSIYSGTTLIRAKRVSNCYMREKKTDRLCVCPDVRLILVLVWKNCLGFSVGYQRAPGWF